MKETNAGPYLYIGDKRVFSWLGTRYNDEAHNMANIINDAHKGNVIEDRDSLTEGRAAMSEAAYKALYEAQKAEHEVTHLRLREAEKVINVLRGEVLMLQTEREKAVCMLQRIAVSIDEVYPPASNAKKE